MTPKPALPPCAMALLAASLLNFGSAALAQQGLAVPRAEATEQRLRLGALELDLAVSDIGERQRVRLLGDYYLTGPGFGHGQVAGGLRLTSGVAMGPRATTPSLLPLRLGGLGGLSEGLRNAGRLPGLRVEREGERVVLPYLGLGYTSLSAQGGWGFTADIGLSGQRPGEPLRLGRSGPTAAQLENVLNDLRLTPVWQLGVSYAF